MQAGIIEFRHVWQEWQASMIVEKFIKDGRDGGEAWLERDR